MHFAQSCRRRIKSIPDLIWAPSASAFLLLFSGGLGFVLGQPWIFPSLGPSALLHAYHPANPTGRFYNTLVGHLCGIAAGYLAVALFHAGGSPPVLSTEELTLPRLLAALLSVFLTVFAQLLVKAFHPPAAATTLLIALGAFKLGVRELEVLVIGVLIIATVGEGVRRIRL